jgi:hypothetical protein
MSDHHRVSTDYADITHAVQVHAVGASHLREPAAPDGGPLFLLTTSGFCRCGAEDEIERSLLLRESEVVNIIAALTDGARLTPLGDDLNDRVEAVIAAAHAELGPPGERPGYGEVIAVCVHCGAGPASCGCGHRLIPPQHKESS